MAAGTPTSEQLATAMALMAIVDSCPGIQAAPSAAVSDNGLGAAGALSSAVAPGARVTAFALGSRASWSDEDLARTPNGEPAIGHHTFTAAAVAATGVVGPTVAVYIRSASGPTVAVDKMTVRGAPARGRRT